MKGKSLYFNEVLTRTVLLGMTILFLSGCVDYVSDSTVNIKNNSSYDLRLIFTYHAQLTNHSPDFYQPFDIVVEKKSTYSFGIFGGLGSLVAPDPNWEFGRIAFYDVKNDEIALKYIEINDFDFVNSIYTQFNEPFQLIEIKDFKQNYQKAVYLFEISDDLWN